MRDYSKQTKPTPERFCLYCGKKLERKRYGKRIEDFKVFNNRKYCDKECMRKGFIKKDGNGQQWSPAHHSARSIVYTIENRPRVCELCGSDKNIDIHHKDGNHLNNATENLMAVCRSCHMKLHSSKQRCKICGRVADGGRGLCNMHYIRWRKYRNPLYYQGRIVSPLFTERKMFIETGPDIEKGEATQMSLF